jgi:hypothetical protein
VWTLIKILTFPIWFPIKLLWLASKILAFIVLVLLVAGLLYIAFHFF